MLPKNQIYQSELPLRCEISADSWFVWHNNNLNTLQQKIYIHILDIILISFTYIKSCKHFLFYKNWLVLQSTVWDIKKELNKRNRNTYACVLHNRIGLFCFSSFIRSASHVQYPIVDSKTLQASVDFKTNPSLFEKILNTILFWYWKICCSSLIQFTLNDLL